MIKGFKDFLMRGNVVDLAVAVVIGTAFAAVIKAFIDGFVKPMIDAIGGKPTSPALGFFLRITTRRRSSTSAPSSARSSTSSIVAAIVYFVIVVPVNKLMERRKRGEEPEVEAPTEDILLLQEIRDLLRQRSIWRRARAAGDDTTSAAALPDSRSSSSSASSGCSPQPRSVSSVVCVGQQLVVVPLLLAHTHQARRPTHREGCGTSTRGG